MSIMNDYEKIKEELGEEMMTRIDCYLSFHPHKQLSDVFYNKDEFEQAQSWFEETPDYIKSNPPLYMVVENYKGLCEHNFVGTKEELIKNLQISEDDFDKLFYRLEDKNGDLEPIREEMPVYCKRANLTYEIHVGNSMDEIKAFFEGHYNDTEMQKENADWYYSFDRGMTGKEGLAILHTFNQEVKILEVLAPELFDDINTAKLKTPEHVSYDEYLNHKPISACTSKRDIERHDLDNGKMFSLIEEMKASAAIVRVTYLDSAHRGEEKAQYVPMDKFREHIDGFDQKNGMDFVIHNGHVGLAIYGQNYTDRITGQGGVVEALLSYQFIDDSKMDSRNIAKELDEITSENEAQKLLGCVSKEDIFLNDSALKENLRNVKRLPLEVQIEKSIKIQKEQQEKRRGKGSKNRVKKDFVDRE